MPLNIGPVGSSDKEYLQNVRAILNYSSEIRHIIGRIALSKDSVKVAGIKEILAKHSMKLKHLLKKQSVIIYKHKLNNNHGL